MADIINVRTKAKERIYSQFPPAEINNIPTSYNVEPLDILRERLKEYDVICWHRLLKSIYQDAQEIEVELYTRNQGSNLPEMAILRRTGSTTWSVFNTTAENITKIELGEITLIPSNWKYYFALPSGGIISIGSRDRVTSLCVDFVLIGGQPKPKDNEDADKFISLLLDEANKSYKQQLFDPEKEFKESEGLRSYILSNVYLSNYKSAGFMLKTAMSQEQELAHELCRYDATRLDLTKEECAHINQHGLVCGMYFLSAITYFYMALEGFINLIFHSFLKKTVKEGPLREGRFQVEKKISDVELKLRLLPVLCDGFSEEHLNASSDVYSKFHQLTEYRNSIFHSKIENSLKSLAFVEDGFRYQCHLSEYTKQFLPSFKLKLTATDVLKVKNIVDEVINSVLQSMTESARALATEYILKSPYISYNITADGSLSIGLSDEEKE